VEVVETRSARGGDALVMPLAAEADPVPLHSGLGVVAVRRDLFRRAGAVIVEPAEVLDQFPVPAVAPQRQLVGVGRMDAELSFLPCRDPLRPGVAEQAIREE